mmetsp:Transcript_88577/g.190173  ORF Transcript_88577/g.190173 Transcript_88577/m.190173 type:complete len:225 (+) Transcript_88577:1655-2329(+)
MDLQELVAGHTGLGPMTIYVGGEGEVAQRTPLAPSSHPFITDVRRGRLVRLVTKVPEAPSEVRLVLEPLGMANLLIGQAYCLQARPDALLTTAEGAQAGVHAHTGPAADEDGVRTSYPIRRLHDGADDLLLGHVRVRHEPLIRHGTPFRPDGAAAHHEHFKLLFRPIFRLKRQRLARIGALLQDLRDLRLGEGSLLPLLLDHHLLMLPQEPALARVLRGHIAIL